MTGYYGSSSLSNLSPLAPPFTVVRSNHNKPVVNSNLVSDFNDPPYSHSTAGQEFFGDSPAIDPAIDHWSTFTRISKRVDDSLFYNFDEAKPFHRPYASRVKNDDIPLVSFSETSSDLFSTSGLVYSGETDYTRNLSGLEYNPDPNPNKEVILSRLSLPEEKSAGKMVKDGSFFLGEANTAASLAYNSYMNQGAYGTESLSKGKDDHSVLRYADIIRRANNNGKSDGTSSFANNHSRLDSVEFPKGDSHFRAFPVLSESHSSLIQSPEDPFWNSQKLNPPYEKRYRHMFEDLKSTTKSSPIVIKSPAAAVTASSASSKSLEIGNAAGVLKISDVAVGSSHKILKEKDELHLPQLSFQIGTTDAAPFSIKDSKLSPSSDQLNFEFKAKPSVLQIPDINIPDAANSLDHHHPAEDSPCWKGTPSLPFGSPEAQPSTKKLQKGTNIQGTDYSYNNHSSDGKTSSSPIPFHSGVGDVVDSLKVRDGGDDANSQIPKLNLTNTEEAVLLLAEMYGETVDKKVNASVLVKAISNISDLLLRACSNEALKEHDREALDHVTRNLGMCMSRHVQVAAASTNKPMSTHSNISQESQVRKETSGMLQDGEQHAHHQKMKSDVCGESVKNLLEHASLRDLDPPKGDNMVQAIKKVLDENLESEMELPSETTLLYKNLWLEAEAELCCLSYRARFERLKRETQKEKPHKSTATGDASAIQETSRSSNGSTFLKADNIKTSNAQHIDAVNVYGGQNPVKKGHVADVKVTGSGVTMQHQLRKDDGDSGVDSLVMARFNILKNREDSITIDLEEAGACGEGEIRFQDQEAAAAAAAMGSGSDWEHILKDEFTWC
ncbi:hypothetical protein L1987_75049 [Smallanthus sonchifolius]|uniref:Uncharacterized protein n=1 Tax=Smallanthus sonchifolius TaxID=185202 RepID=A0ACB9A5D7_9ASTR|nr:hypothetical protein L1987_75049 [Smallanthus sonchifolius]